MDKNWLLESSHFMHLLVALISEEHYLKQGEDYNSHAVLDGLLWSIGAQSISL